MIGRIRTGDVLRFETLHILILFIIFFIASLNMQ